jgi:hypothetical protein
VRQPSYEIDRLSDNSEYRDIPRKDMPPMNLKIRRTLVVVEERREEAGRAANLSLRRVAAVAVIENPYAGRYIDDLAPMIDGSIRLGRELAELALSAFGKHEVQSYGKGGIVGMNGEQEHANALLTTAFANPIRDMLGGGDAWISSFTKKAAPGAIIDIPMNHKDDVYVRSHYDGMSVVLPDAPMPDEVAVIFCLANRGRLNARVGGLTHEEAVARNAVKRS